jgi:cytochrome c
MPNAGPIYNSAMRLSHVTAATFLTVALQGCSNPDAPADGASVFKMCASCHQVGPNARRGFGPQLNGLFGRRAGNTPDYTYSDAMLRSGIIWNEQTLSAFLRDPDKTVPGNKMRFWGLHDDNQIRALVAYLRRFQEAH